MKNFYLTLVHTVILLLTHHLAMGHEEPTSFIDLKVTQDFITATLTASTVDLAHDLEKAEPQMLLQPKSLEKHKALLAQTILSRFQIVVNEIPLQATLKSITAIPEKQDVRMEFLYDRSNLLDQFYVKCKLFPYDTRHRTYLNVYRGEHLKRQAVFENEVVTANFILSEHQSKLTVIREFIREGIHHIFIGPDHILFVIGLLLLGGSMVKLLQIVTAFTLAHSITLGLATFHLLNPPVSLIEPIIALSIVVVGIHAFMGGKHKDPRLLFAFGFGLIHGFGFANVLQEMELPQAALGWSLVSFNIGVELGQACIILAIAPLLALLRNFSPMLARHTIHFAALTVTTAGAFWFFQRIL
jgi:hydrogenase/urease accessory protein HupE